jgi:Cys-rich protein (TIGR01571 family)
MSSATAPLVSVSVDSGDGPAAQPAPAPPAAFAISTRTWCSSACGDPRNPHWAEDVAGNSLWPELCCAWYCPWYMASRVWCKLGWPGAPLFMLVCLGLWAPANLDTIRAVLPTDTSLLNFIPALPQGVFLPVAIGCYVTLLVIIIWLRGAVRKQLGVPGSLASDACATVPWLGCALPCVQGFAHELATMDRQVTPDAVAPAAARAVMPRARWTPGSCNCSCAAEDNMPSLCCAQWCACFMQARIMWRLGVADVRTKMVLLFAVELIVPAALYAANTFTGNSVLLTAATVMFLLPSALVNLMLRRMVRERYQLPGDCCGDCIFPLVCAACSLAQLGHETAPKFEVAAAAAAGGGAGAITATSGAAKSGATEQTRLSQL